MSVYDFSYVSIEGVPVKMTEYRGKVLLIVNTASKCGFTPQYKSGYGDNQIKWNFTKFLIDKNGEVVDRYEPTIKPVTIAAAIEKLL